MSQMTVAELRKRLEHFDPSWPILIQDDTAVRPPMFVLESTEREFVPTPNGNDQVLADIPVVLIC